MTSTCEDGVVSNSAAATIPVASGFPVTVEAERWRRSAPSVRGRATVRGRTEVAPAVLVADDEPMTRRTLRRYLESVGYKVLEASGGHQAIALMSENVAVAILDLGLPEVSGMDCLRQIRQQFPDTPVIVICIPAEIQAAVAAVGQGAFQYLIKPLDRREFLAQLRLAAHAFRLARENRSLRQAVTYPMASVELVGSSAAMRSVRKQIEAYAQLDSTVLITGAEGTGKTTVARWIHDHGPRAARPLAAVDCGSLPCDLAEVELFGCIRGAVAVCDRPGRAEIADGGALLLDEVGELPMELQERLLCFLQDGAVRRVGSNSAGRVDVRVIATTRRNLAQMCRDGDFREDLLFRLNVLSVSLSSLAERSADIPELTSEILRRIARRRNCPPPALTDDAIQILRQHNWPGNVRELEGVLQRATVSGCGSVIRGKDLVIEPPQRMRQSPGGPNGLGLAGMTLAEIERCAVIETIRSTGGNKAKAARQLEVSEKTIYNKIKQYNLAGRT